MKRILQIISLVGLMLTLLPPVFYFYDRISYNSQNILILAGSVIWFASAINWLAVKSKKNPQ